MINLPTSYFTTQDFNGKRVLKLEVHNWCQEISIRNIDGKCISYSDGSQASLVKLLSFYDESDRDKIMNIILSVADEEMSNRINGWYTA
ncbi:hypothetical protein ACX818_001260 [Acinetobacter baumannii]